MTRTPLAWAARILAGTGIAAALVLTTGVGTASATNTPSPTMTQLKIWDDGAWVQGTFPAGSGVWEINTYDPTNFDAQILTDHDEVDATTVTVSFDKVLRIKDPGCAQVDVFQKGEEQVVGADLRTDTCLTTTSTTAPPPTTTTAPPVAQDLTSSTVAPATVQDLTSDTVAPVVETPATPEVPTTEVGITTAQTARARIESMPVTGSSDTFPLAGAGLGFMAAGAGVLVLRRRLMA